MKTPVNQYFQEQTQWKVAMKKLRSLLADTELIEEFKWKAPCYTIDGKNVVILASLKNYCALSFFKGILLKDSKGLLVKPGKNSQSVRMFKFQSIDEVLAVEKTIIAYLKEAIALEKSGAAVANAASINLELCPELKEIFFLDKKYEQAFKSLSPGRQRGYHLFFSAAMKSATIISRIHKNKERILDGYGIHDCSCGLSKRLPSCDGSHKRLIKK